MYFGFEIDRTYGTFWFIRLFTIPGMNPPGYKIGRSYAALVQAPVYLQVINSVCNLQANLKPSLFRWVIKAYGNQIDIPVALSLCGSFNNCLKELADIRNREQFLFGLPIKSVA